jgi:hypothetical protein
MFQKGIIITFVLIVIVYILTNKKQINTMDASLLLVSIVALSWKQMTYKHTIEKYLEVPETLSSLLNTLKPINDEEDFKPISKNLLMYYTTYNSISHTYGTKIWRNVIDTTATKTGELQCNTSMYFDLLPSFSKIAGFTLGPNKLTGPYSNTLGINYRGQYSLMLIFKHGNLRNDSTALNKIELVKLWANSPNNNGISLYLEPGSLDVINNTQFGKLMFQYADYSPIHCKISKTDDLLPIDNNVLCFLFIVKDDDKVKVQYMTEKSNTIVTLAEFNVATTDITFSNKEIFINRFGNWNANMFNFGIYKVALSDVNISNIYQHIKNLYLRTIDPNYKPIVDTYNETINKLNKYIQCPFDEKTCLACKDVVEWNDINQVMGSSFNCRKAISAFCKKNTSHSFCKCWNTKLPEYNSSNCKVLRSMFENDKMTCLTHNEILNMTKQCNKQADEAGLNYVSDYTFDKVRVKYDDSLTTQERIQLGKDVSAPDFMSVGDFQAGLAKSAIRIADNYDKNKKEDKSKDTKSTKDTETNVKDVNKITEDELLMKEIIKTEEDIKLSKKTDGGLWSILKIFG